MSDYKTPFKDAIAGEMTFTIKPTLGTDPTSMPSSADAGVSGSVSPVQLPLNDLHFGTPGKQ